MNRDTRLIALAFLLWGVGEGLFLHVQPLYIRQLGANPVQIGGLLSAMSVVSAVSFLPAGANTTTSAPALTMPLAMAAELCTAAIFTKTGFV